MHNAVADIKKGNVKRKILKNVLRVIKKNIGAWMIMLPGILLFIAFVWQPLVSGLVLSFFKTKGFEAEKFIGFQNFKDVLSDSVFIKTLQNSVSYTLWSLVIGFGLPIIIAILLNEIVHFQSFFKTAIYFPAITSGVVTSIMWLIFFDPSPNGILNTIITRMGFHQSQWLQDSRFTIILIVISMTWKGAGGTTILYLASIQGINNELYEAAKIDGAGILSRVKNVTLPQISNIIALCFISQIIAVFQVMVEPLTMTDGGPNNASVSLALQSYFYAFRYGQIGKSIALSTLTFIMLIGLTIVYFVVNKRHESA